MPYVYLALAIAFEVGWAACMKPSNGFTRLWPTVALLVLYALSLVALTLAVRRLPVGMTYAIWTGSGAALIGVLAWVFLNEAMPPLKVASLVLVVTGVVGLHLGAPHSGAARPVSATPSATP